MWWTITGNFGNLLPIDWSKSHTRQKFLPVLNLNSDVDGNSPASTGATPLDGGEEEEAVAQDLDLHTLILGSGDGTTPCDPPLKTAEEVIREIDDIMQEGSSSEDEGCTSTHSSASADASLKSGSLRPLPSPLYHDKLSKLSVPQLNECLMELEAVISQYSETLISQLALRDELEFQKELKNTFISLLLQVQNKRRSFNVDKKNVKKTGINGAGPKYLTTVIPYDVGHGPPDNQSLQILNKILTAINEDSPTVPALLTDYILKVLCPS
ncbi:Fasciculation and elongation protein zeta FEZ [Trinorchestia longiramus]|nr:Fasciculation and elongation protein zeta FEZ [Trinorchestia longiramus]